MSGVQAVTTETFDTDVLESDVPVLVDFWAVWCGPCKLIAPHLDILSQEYEGKAKIVKVNIDNDREVAERYSVMSIPTLIFFSHGKAVDQIIGAVPRNVIQAKLDQVIVGDD